MTTVADIAPKADPDWTSCALTAIAALARTGQQFTASDVADLMGPRTRAQQLLGLRSCRRET